MSVERLISQADEQRRLTATVVSRVKSALRGMDISEPGPFMAAFGRFYTDVMEQAVWHAVTRAGQVARVDARDAGLVTNEVARAEKFARVSAYGRAHADVVWAPVREYAQLLDAGADEKLLQQQWRRLVNQVAVATRHSLSVAASNARAATVIRDERAGYIRVANSPCCVRCAVLGGRVYEGRQVFRRHPQCDCTGYFIRLGEHHGALRELKKAGLVRSAEQVLVSLDESRQRSFLGAKVHDLYQAGELSADEAVARAANRNRVRRVVPPVAKARVLGVREGEQLLAVNRARRSLPFYDEITVDRILQQYAAEDREVLLDRLQQQGWIG